MSQFDAAAPQPNADRTGFSKHLLWILPTGCLVVLLCCCGGGGGLLWFGYNMVTTHPVYTQGVERASSDPTVREWLGTPIEAGFFTEAEINETDQARLTLPLTGPEGSATLEMDAYLVDGRWEFENLEVTSHETGETVQLADPLPQVE